MFKKILENSDIPNVAIEGENEYIKTIHRIIVKKTSDEEEKISQIKQWYKSIKGRKNISRTEFYKDVGLDEELGNKSDEKNLLIGNFIKQLDIPLIKLLINKKQHDNKELNKELNKSINNRLRELGVPEHVVQSIKIRQIGNNSIVVKGWVDLGTKTPKGKIPKKTPEEKVPDRNGGIVYTTKNKEEKPN
ncbi:MAG: hypothetical protein LBH96_01115 [Candidatus Peribacteria bacterium]|jgi:hypothetical protein|nr:hypothetical protein [Candidatus Peribacteria bacterium]